MNEPKPWLTQSGGIAARLDALIEASGISGKELAGRLGWATSKVSRVRNGITEPTVDDVRRLAQATGAEAQVDDLLAILREVPAAKDEFRGRLAEVQKVHNNLLAESRHVRYFDTVWIPGLLQTREYARRALGEIEEITGNVGDLDAAVAGRMKRQSHLFEADKTFEIMMWEPALTNGSVTDEILIPQLHVLLTWLNAPNVQVAVLPLRGKNRRTPMIGFQMYDEMAIVEDWIGEWERPADMLAQIFKDMWANAAVGEAARPFIEKAIDECQRQA